MDPYLESRWSWRDFSIPFICAISNGLLEKLFPKYDVHIREYFLPTTFDPTLDEKHRRLDIVTRPSHESVTYIEVLSPDHKLAESAARKAYMAQRSKIIESGFNLVEIDLLRQGVRLPSARHVPPNAYVALIGRAGPQVACEVFQWSLQEALPGIPIPLLPEDGTLQFDLVEPFRDTHERGIFDRRLPYHEPLDPRPDEKTQDWIDEWLANRNH